MNIEPGDFVNFTDWFGDVFAQVLSVLGGDGDKPIIRYCCYNKGGTERWVGWEMGKVRRVVKAADAATSERIRYASVLYTPTEYRGGFDRHMIWPTALDIDSRASSNHRETHPKLVG
jgi:hypothetical protein